MSRSTPRNVEVDELKRGLIRAMNDLHGLRDKAEALIVERDRYRQALEAIAYSESDNVAFMRQRARHVLPRPENERG